MDKLILYLNKSALIAIAHDAERLAVHENGAVFKELCDLVKKHSNLNSIIGDLINISPESSVPNHFYGLLANTEKLGQYKRLANVNFVVNNIEGLKSEINSLLESIK